MKQLIESRRTLGGEESGTRGFRDTVREREFEVLGQELLDVWSLNVVGLLELNNLEDLYAKSVSSTTNWCHLGSSYVDGPEAGAMSGSHVLVQSLNSVGS
jgi:hypothetical protein